MFRVVSLIKTKAQKGGENYLDLKKSDGNCYIKKRLYLLSTIALVV